jgi:hypothetical protein
MISRKEFKVRAAIREDIVLVFSAKLFLLLSI